MSEKWRRYNAMRALASRTAASRRDPMRNMSTADLLNSGLLPF